MLVIDASCLYEVVAGTSEGEPIRCRLDADPDLAAPHVVDVEVFGVVARDLRIGRLDGTGARQAIENLRDWPGERFDHRALLARAWELRNNVRGSDGVYVALAETLAATLITVDGRLGRAPGITCQIEVIGPGR